MKDYRFQIGASFLAFFIARFFEISTYFLVSLGIDAIQQVIEKKPPEYSIGQVGLGIVFCVLMRFIVVIYARRGLRRVGFAVCYDLRQKLFSIVQLQGSEFFARMGVGDIMTRAIQDISLIQRLISFGSFGIVIMVYAPFFAIIAMTYKSPLLTLLILPVLPLIFYYGWRMSGEMAESSLAMQEGLSALTSHTQENLSGIRTVQAQAQEQNEIKRFWVTNDQYARAFFNQARINSLMTAWMPWLASAAQLLIIIYGGNLVLEDELSVGDLIFFLACLNMLLQPIRMAGMLVTMVQRGAVASRRLYEIFDAEPEISDQPSGQTPMNITGDFELQGLSYTYAGADEPILKDINLHIRSGESIGIVGRVGSGKSTLLKQFTRMLDSTEGQLLVDGFDIKDYPLQQIRRQVAQVLQDPFLFAEPLRNNISYDEPDRDLQMIWDSAESAALKDTILEFPEQLDTLVGERGVTLSGGQKQRTTLARGFIRDASVLILDDCFSSVDTETEEHILSRLKSQRGDRTTILVSHRVSTLRHSDRIVVMEEGTIAEVGSHEELLALNGLYAELERLQTQGSDPNRLVDVELTPV
ncbi:MAG: ATP-binding cassette subfamily B protein [Candidatus Azotimanducaceae bacterium]